MKYTDIKKVGQHNHQLWFLVGLVVFYFSMVYTVIGGITQSATNYLCFNKNTVLTPLQKKSCLHGMEKFGSIPHYDESHRIFHVMVRRSSG